MERSEAGQWLRNGQPLAPEAGVDRGLQFGDGVFETMAARDGQIPFIDRHLERLRLGCQRLGLEAPPPALMEEELRATIPRRGRAVVKLVLAACQGGRGYQRPYPQATERYVAHFPWPGPWPDSLSLWQCRLRLSRQPALAGIKHCNRLEQVLARREVTEAGQDEGLLLDSADQVVEGVAANIFVIRKHQLLTPDLEQAGVAGIMRARVLEVASRENLPARVTTLRLADILEADEVFMCNSLMGLRPVHRLLSDQHDQQWRTGPISTRLQAEINEWR